MADLGVLQPGAYTNVASTAIQGSDPVLEEIGSADDADYAYDATNSTHTGSCYFAIEDTPSDLGNVDTLSVRLRYHWATGTQVNTWDSLRARVYKSDGTTALTNEATVASTITTTSATTSSVINFTGVDTAASKTDWDGARLYVYWFVTRAKGGDSIQKRVTAGELTGTYTAALPNQDITPAAASITVTPGTLTVTRNQPIAPAAASITVTPGTLTVTQEQIITPAAASVTVTPGTLTVRAVAELEFAEPVPWQLGYADQGNLAVEPAAASITVTPGSLTVTQEQTVTPDGVTITVTPGTVTVTQEQVVSPDAVSISVTPGTLTVTQDQPIAPDAVSITVTPGSLTVTQEEPAPAQEEEQARGGGAKTWFQITRERTLAEDEEMLVLL